MVSRAGWMGGTPGRVFTNTVGQLTPKLCSHCRRGLVGPAVTSPCRAYSILNRASRGIASRGQRRSARTEDCLQMERTASEKVLLSRFEAGKTVKTKRWTVRARLKKIAALASARVRPEREPRFCEIQNGASHELTTFRPVLTWNWADLWRVEVCGLLLPSTHFCQLCAVGSSPRIRLMTRRN